MPAGSLLNIPILYSHKTQARRMKHLLRNSLLTSALALVALSSCINDTDQPTLGPNEGSRSYTRRQFDTLTLEAATSAQWMLGDSVVGQGLRYSFSATRPGTYHISYTQDGKKVDNVVTITPRFTSGTFLLNEGNYSTVGGHGVGSLTYIDPQERFVLPYAYYKVNGENLGHVCEDLTIANGKLYIISQNGKTADGRGNGNLTIANAQTLERIDVIGTTAGNELASQTPSHIAVVGDSIYLRGSKGVIIGSEKSKSFKLIAGTAGAAAKPFAVIGNTLYAIIAGDKESKVIQIQGTEVTASLTIANDKLDGIVATADGKGLLVSKIGPESRLYRIAVEPGKLTLTATDELASVNPRLTEWGAANAIVLYGDDVYYATGTKVISRYNLTTKTTTQVRDFADTNVAHLNMYYNSFSVDPRTGALYFASVDGYGTYTQNAVVWAEPKAGGSFFSGESAAYFPAAFYFIR